MTRATEIDRVSRAEARRIKNERRSPRIMFQAHLRHMLCSRTMACFTVDTRNQTFGMKLTIRGRGRGMAAKAQWRLVGGHAPPECGFDAARLEPGPFPFVIHIRS